MTFSFHSNNDQEKENENWEEFSDDLLSCDIYKKEEEEKKKKKKKKPQQSISLTIIIIYL